MHTEVHTHRIIHLYASTLEFESIFPFSLEAIGRNGLEN